MLLRESTLDNIHLKVANILSSVIPSFISTLYKAAYKWVPKWTCEFSSYFVSLGVLSWLVGPVERFHVQRAAAAIDEVDGQIVRNIAHSSPHMADIPENWNSGIKITKCRYLKAVGCKSACLHICKRPTQELFNVQFGVPLHMKPNFTDHSCELHFGVVPPKMEDDPSYEEGCYSMCSLGKLSKELKC